MFRKNGTNKNDFQRDAEIRGFTEVFSPVDENLFSWYTLDLTLYQLCSKFPFCAALSAGIFSEAKCRGSGILLCIGFRKFRKR
ncbi:MAG: hypothetical protein Q4C96_11655 [Planctomycetia bacterium]|nr:hypothetical protein [Planctomycetia bacterium]